MKLTESEWAVMEVLWKGENFSLKEITNSLHDVNSWNKNTVHTYLNRMEKKGFVCIDKGHPKPYRANVSREECACEERNELLSKVYKGATGDLIAAFLKDTKITESEVRRLKKMLDEMEV